MLFFIAGFIYVFIYVEEFQGDKNCPSLVDKYVAK